MPSQPTCDGGGKSLDLERSRNRVALAVQDRLIAWFSGCSLLLPAGISGFTDNPHLDEPRTQFKEAAHTILSNRFALVRIFKEGV
jgi:hypothetical protein